MKYEYPDVFVDGEVSVKPIKDLGEVPFLELINSVSFPVGCLFMSSCGMSSRGALSGVCRPI